MLGRKRSPSTVVVFEPKTTNKVLWALLSLTFAFPVLVLSLLLLTPYSLVTIDASLTTLFAVIGAILSALLVLAFYKLTTRDVSVVELEAMEAEKADFERRIQVVDGKNKKKKKKKAKSLEDEWGNREYSPSLPYDASIGNAARVYDHEKDEWVTKVDSSPLLAPDALVGTPMGSLRIGPGKGAHPTPFNKVKPGSRPGSKPGSRAGTLTKKSGMIAGGKIQSDFLAVEKAGGASVGSRGSKRSKGSKRHKREGSHASGRSGKKEKKHRKHRSRSRSRGRSKERESSPKKSSPPDAPAPPSDSIIVSSSSASKRGSSISTPSSKADPMSLFPPGHRPSTPFPIKLKSPNEYSPEEVKAATRIQAVARGRAVRRKGAKAIVQELRTPEEREAAAKKIQKWYRVRAAEQEAKEKKLQALTGGMLSLTAPDDATNSSIGTTDTAFTKDSAFSGPSSTTPATITPADAAMGSTKPPTVPPTPST